MRVRGLECLVSILKCMVEWSNDLYVDPNSQCNHLDPESTSAHKYKANKSAVIENNSNSSDANANNLKTLNSSGEEKVPDKPCKLQVLKHKKDIWETGILM